MLENSNKKHYLAISVVATTDDDFLASRDSKVKSNRKVSFSRFKLSTISFCRSILCEGLSSFELIFFKVDISLNLDLASNLSTDKKICPEAALSAQEKCSQLSI